MKEFDGSIILSGWLKKKGERVFEAWKRRFFNNNGTRLLAYKVDSAPETPPKGAIDLKLVTDVYLDKNNNEKFNIVCPNRTYHLMAESENDARRWVQDLRDFLRLNEKKVVEQAPKSSEKDKKEIPTASLLTKSTLNRIEKDESSEEHKRLEAQRKQRETDLLEKQKEREEREKQRLAKAKEREEKRKLLAKEREREQELRQAEESQDDELSDHEPTPPGSPLVLSMKTPKTPQHTSSVDSLKEKFRLKQSTLKEKSSKKAQLNQRVEEFKRQIDEKKQLLKVIRETDPEILELQHKIEEQKSMLNFIELSNRKYQEQKEFQVNLLSQIKDKYQEISRSIENVDASILEKEEEVFEKDSSLYELDTKLYEISHAKLKMNIQSTEDLEETVEFQLEALSSLKQQQEALEDEINTKNETYGVNLKAREQQIEQLIAQSDLLRRRLQQVRSKSHLDEDIAESIMNIEKDYFIMLVTSIKLNFMNEGHVIRQTSPTELYDIVKDQNISRDEWPKWVAEELNTRIVTDGFNVDVETKSSIRPPSRKIRRPRKKAVAVTGIGYVHFIAS